MLFSATAVIRTYARRVLFSRIFEGEGGTPEEGIAGEVDLADQGGEAERQAAGHTPTIDGQPSEQASQMDESVLDECSEEECVVGGVAKAYVTKSFSERVIL